MFKQALFSLDGGSQEKAAKHLFGSWAGVATGGVAQDARAGLTSSQGACRMDEGACAPKRLLSGLHGPAQTSPSGGVAQLVRATDS